MRIIPVRLYCCLVFLAFSSACDDTNNDDAANSPTPDVVVTPIWQIQGDGAASPIEGQDVVVIGVVSGDFQDDDADDSRNLGGFFLQAGSPDDNPETSDGVFVYDGNIPLVDISVGQIVQVTGTVTERFGETQITASAITATGAGDVQALTLSFPVTVVKNSDGQEIAALERFEGMLVELAEPAVITEAFDLARFGEITVALGGRLRQFTNANPPEVAGNAMHESRQAGRTLILDDGLSVQSPAAYRYLNPRTSNSTDYTLRIGDTVQAVVGNIRYSRGAGTEAYRLEPTADPQFVSRNSRSAVPPDTGGTVTVASFNVLNYFTTIDTGKNICGPAGDTGCRGADNAAEFDRQREKTVNTLTALDADIVGLIEIENNAGAALRSIVSGLNNRAGAGTWDFVPTGVLGTDAIAVGLIYRADIVQPAGNFAVLTSSVDARFDDQKNRPTLAQSFDVIEGGGRFTVAVNHLKSKGSDCNDVNDPDRNDGQGNCNGTRTRAAVALGDWLNSDPTGSGDLDFLIIGDLNAYMQEDPVTALKDIGFTNLLESVAGSDAYSFVFNGQAGALDHAFASRTLSSQVTGVAEWHINADETPLIDYNLDFGRDAGYFDGATPFRTSDHDPVIVGIDP
ncbi:MAG: ExeM/NucH family extracellular endonuclease [Proteobacteria bacterium]|nr:ExeM/NucH family extracellular endonuclease [Pseudomonadota bacterium]